MDVSVTKSILTRTASFASKLIHHKEKDMSSADNLTNFTNPLESTIESGNDIFTFKETTRQPNRLDFVEEMRKYISAHEDYKHWNLFSRKELDGKKNIMSIWSFKRNRYPYVRLINHNDRLCAHGVMQEWGLNYWET